MELFSAILTVLGLSLFEVILSIDNAIINAEVLSKMSQWARRWFLLWGLLFAVFVVRGLLPWLILWLSAPELGLIGAFMASFSNDPAVAGIIAATAPILFIGGGVFLVFLFFHWLFLEPKHYGLIGEEYIQRKGVWFFAVVSILLAAITWFAIHRDPFLAFGAVVGSTVFFITHGFKENAERAEEHMLEGSAKLSDWSKIFYLEVIDATFSIDGVLGAFAFTFSIPLILLGTGIGAFVLRHLTVSNIENVKRYKYLKNGAMYSILALGVIMLLHSFGYHIPEWVSPIVTFGITGAFFWKSVRAIKNEKVSHRKK